MTGLINGISGVVFALFTSVLMLFGIYYYRDKYLDEKHLTEDIRLLAEQRQKTITGLKKQQQRVASLDARYTAELSRANEEIEKLRTDIAAGRKRLYVKASCPELRDTSATPGLDDAATARLGINAEQDYLRLREQVTQMQKQLEGLQTYARETTE